MIYVQYFATSFIHAVPFLLLVVLIIVELCSPKKKEDKTVSIEGTDEDGIERIKCKHDLNLTGLCIKDDGNCKTFGECSRRCNK